MWLTLLFNDKLSRRRFTGKPGDPSPPIFERIFKNARFAQGGNAIFEGCVRGNPKPTVSWTHKGVPLLESRKIRMSYDNNTGVVTLQINQIGPGDEGEYTCSAKNQYGEINRKRRKILLSVAKEASISFTFRRSDLLCLHTT